MKTETLTMSVDEMAKLLPLSRPKAYELANSDGFYPAVRLSPRKIAINRLALQKWLDEGGLKNRM